MRLSVAAVRRRGEGRELAPVRLGGDRRLARNSGVNTLAGPDARQQVVELQPPRNGRPRDLHVARALAEQAAPKRSGKPSASGSISARLTRAGNVLVGGEQLVARVARVAAEELVAAVAGEHPRDAGFVRELRAEERRQRRRVAERLIERRGDLRDALDQIVGRDVVLVMIGAEMPRGDPRVLHFVVPGGIEADRERLHRLAA